MAIRALKRYVTEQFGVESFHRRRPSGTRPTARCLRPTGSSVGIIGGGPAGLSAAYELRLRGHPVTVYEAADRLGGMMVLGIPEYRLSRELIAREIEAIVELGIDVDLGARIGETVTVDELLARHDQLFVAVGTGRGRCLDLPGADQDGVVRAVEFLLNVNQGFRVQLGRRVVVVGGGNVAFDAARTALRAAAGGSDDAGGPTRWPARLEDARRAMTTTLDVARTAVREGVESVTVIALESEPRDPGRPRGDRRGRGRGHHHRVPQGPAPLRRRATVGSPASRPSTWRRSSTPRAGSPPRSSTGTEAVLPADTVILAVGQAAELDFLADHPVERSRGGGIAGRPGHAAHLRSEDLGRRRRGPRAPQPDRRRRRRPARRPGHPRRVTPGDRRAPAPEGPRPARGVRVELTRRPGYRRLATGYDAIDRQAVPATPTERRTGFAEVEIGYDGQDAWLESLRCLRCFDNIMLEPSLCILCGLCVDVCPTDCITIARADHLELGTEDQSVLLLDEDQCIRCGLCVNRCPPGALSMVNAQEVASGRQRV